MEGWMSPEELNWELEFNILVTEDTSSKVHQLGSANKLVAGTRVPLLVKVCHPMQESTQYILLPTGGTNHPFTSLLSFCCRTKLISNVFAKDQCPRDCNTMSHYNQ